MNQILLRTVSGFRIGGLVALVACGGGCAPAAPATEVPPALEHVAELHKAKCGNCHIRVEPGTRSREELEAVFPRHRARVHLSDDEWNQMVEYLAVPPSSPLPSMQPLRGDKQG